MHFEARNDAALRESAHITRWCVCVCMGVHQTNWSSLALSFALCRRYLCRKNSPSAATNRKEPMYIQ